MTGSRSPVRVAVTGIGVFSAFGRGTGPLREAVFAGRQGFRPVTRFDASRFRADTAAHADASPSLAQAFTDAARDAMRDAALPEVPRAGVLLGTQGDWSGLTRFWRDGSADGVAEAVAGSHAHLLAAALGLRGGRRRVYNNGCIAAATALAQGAHLVAGGREPVVLAGGGYLVDAEFFAKFDSGRALSTEGTVRPFSATRSGLLLGDGVAVLVLEPFDAAVERGATPLAVIRGAALTADAYHVCRPHPDGVGLAAAMGDALRMAGTTPSEVGYINAHGTGTQINDPSESAAVRRVFGRTAPPISSTKSCTGHALEGSGALEAVISVLALRHGVLPPTAGYEQPDPDCDLDYVPNDSRPADVRIALSLSAAFGGANAALVFERCP